MDLFTATVSLTEGANSLTSTATDALNHTATVSMVRATMPRTVVLSYRRSFRPGHSARSPASRSAAAVRIGALPGFQIGSARAARGLPATRCGSDPAPPPR
ncbi:MAG: hypothetical protein GY854_12625 [Deltaproteobacteria bacterium]|nr:hypothetical protein [Deltaproteobacteria bacterium]